MCIDAILLQIYENFCTLKGEMTIIFCMNTEPSLFHPTTETNRTFPLQLFLIKQTFNITTEEILQRNTARV